MEERRSTASPERLSSGATGWLGRGHARWFDLSRRAWTQVTNFLHSRTGPKSETIIADHSRDDMAHRGFRRQVPRSGTQEGVKVSPDRLGIFHRE